MKVRTGREARTSTYIDWLRYVDHETYDILQQSGFFQVHRPTVI